MNYPMATYRIQFNKDFGFDHAAAIATYLKELGISHLYASPYLKSVSGSPHGYNCVDFSKVNPELGGAKGHERLIAALKKSGIKQNLDIVPNHMAAHSSQNSMWRDVLKSGQESPYADFFDVLWNTGDVKTRQKVLIPVLGDHYDTCLANKQLKFKRLESEIILTYFEHDLPLSKESIDMMLDVAKFPEEQKKDFDINKNSTQIDKLLKNINKDPDLIHQILEQQHYRLAFWRTAASDINYRRFFDINELVGIRMERKEVFEEYHHLIIKWIRNGIIDGLRIDHPDGLCDPEEYLIRLRESTSTNTWVIVEKILDNDETLPKNWPVSGTTGYDFLNRVNGLFVDPNGEKQLTLLYEDITEQTNDFPEIVRQKKLLVLEKSFSGEINNLTRMLLEIRFRHRRYRDLTGKDMRIAVKEVIACFPVYRTYTRPDLSKISPEDEHRIRTGIDRARGNLLTVDYLTLELIEKLLLLKIRGDCESEFVIRFQQLTGPTMAKGVEDTTFYCFNRLISLNEVGGNPGVFGSSVKNFHDYCRYIQKNHPQTMSATSTHDTKRGEDTRIRINLLSEIPERWSETVRHWFSITSKYKENDLPDANTLYFLFQTLVGAWPVDIKRLSDYMQKAVREAKVYTSWSEPDEVYESALRYFIEKILSDKDFKTDLEIFLSQLLEPARISSLSQTLIKCMAPGVPDFYQGSELWDLSLVDPDNRRLVNFDHRQKLLSEIQKLPVHQILSRFDDGLPKLFTIQKALSVRNLYKDAFGPKSTYRPLIAEGSKAGHLIAFIRKEKIATLSAALACRPER